MDGEKPNYYAVIPAQVRYDPDLKDKAKLLYGEIAALSDKNGYCTANNKYFARLYEIDVSTVSRLIKNLADKNYIKTELIYKEGTKEIEKRYMQICLEGIGKNSIDNKEEEEYNSKIFNLIENNLNRVLSPIEYEVIKNWDYSIEIIELAVKEAILHNAKTIKYIDRILFNWKQNNVETLEDAKKYLDEYSNKVNPKVKEETKVFNPYRNLDDE